MKFLYMIFKNIQGFITKEYRIFVIMFIGLTATSFSSLILFSFSLETRSEYEKEFGYKSRTYTINCERTDNSKAKYMLEKLDSYFSDIKTEISEVCLMTKASSKMKYTVVGYYSNKDLFYCREGRSYKNLGKNIADRIIIPWEGLVDYTKKTSYVNEDFNIGSNKYKITGTAMYCPKNTVYIPYKTYVADGYDISIISIIPEKKLNSNEYIAFKKFIESYIPTAAIISPPMIDKKQESAFLAKFFQYICLLIFALINVIRLFNFWVYKNGPQFIISRLCGASSSYLYRMIIVESILVCSISFIVGYLIYVLTIPLLKELNAYFSLNWINVAIAYFIMIIAVYILVHKTAIKVIKTIDLYNFRWRESI